MNTLKNVFIVGGLVAALGACKNDREDPTSPKAIEDREKAAMEAGKDMADQRENVIEARQDLREEQAELQQHAGEFERRRSEFTTRAQARMSELDTRIDAIKTEVQAHGGRLEADTRQEMNELVSRLEEQRARARNAFNAASSGAHDRWDELERNTGEALGDLEETADDAVEKLKDADLKMKGAIQRQDVDRTDDPMQRTR